MNRTIGKIVKHIVVAIFVVVFAIPAGIPLVFLGTAVASGGFENAVNLIGTSISCSCGLSLIVIWLPLCWVVGLIAITLARLAIRRSWRPEPQAAAGTAEEPADTKVVSSSQVMSIAQYMTQADLKGFEPEAVDACLRQAGWSDREIRGARWSLET